MKTAVRPALVTMIISAFALVPGRASAATCNVPSGAYPTIASAEADASCNPIRVAAGTLNESGIVVDRSVTIRGAGMRATVVNGGTNTIFLVNAGVVTISGLTARNGGLASNNATLNNQTDLTLRRLLITGNQNSNEGGGILNSTGTGDLLLIESIVDRSFSGGRGGGVLSHSGASLTVRRSAITTNGSGSINGGQGGAIYQLGGSAVIEDSTVSGNGALTDGGGIAVVAGGSLTIRRSTISNNTADADNNGTGDGGGLYAAVGTPPITGIILADNIDRGGEAPECGGSATYSSQGHNVIRTFAGCGISGAPGDRIGQPGSEIDARLKPLAFNGGPTPTHALKGGSPARDIGGSCAGVTDQRGVPRPRGSACDAGSYELARCAGRRVNIVGTPEADTLIGTSGRDGILGRGGRDVIRGKRGGDGICGGRGRDRLRGGRGKDRIRGGKGADRIFGGKADDRLRGNRGNDHLNGGDGTDRCRGGAGANTLTSCEL